MKRYSPVTVLFAVLCMACPALRAQVLLLQPNPGSPLVAVRDYLAKHRDGRAPLPAEVTTPAKVGHAYIRDVNYDPNAVIRLWLVVPNKRAAPLFVVIYSLRLHYPAAPRSDPTFQAVSWSNAQ